MLQRLVFRICFKWSSWVLIGFLLLYIYVVALYFLYTNQTEVERYVLEEKERDIVEHPVHNHLIADVRGLPKGFKSWSEVRCSTFIICS
jgi:hypothetical protein